MDCGGRDARARRLRLSGARRRRVRPPQGARRAQAAPRRPGPEGPPDGGHDDHAAGGRRGRDGVRRQRAGADPRRRRRQGLGRVPPRQEALHQAGAEQARDRLPQPGPLERVLLQRRRRRHPHRPRANPLLRRGAARPHGLRDRAPLLRLRRHGVLRGHHLQARAELRHRRHEHASTSATRTSTGSTRASTTCARAATRSPTAARRTTRRAPWRSWTAAS